LSVISVDVRAAELIGRVSTPPGQSWKDMDFLL